MFPLNAYNIYQRTFNEQRIKSTAILHISLLYIVVEGVTRAPYALARVPNRSASGHAFGNLAILRQRATH